MNKLSINRWLAHVICWMSVVVLSANCEPQRNPNISVTSVSINPSNVYICVGESTQLAATVMPEDATDKTVTWSSSDPTIASVNEGKVTALKEGETIITASAGNAGAWCLVKVLPSSIDGGHEGTGEKIWK